MADVCPYTRVASSSGPISQFFQCCTLKNEIGGPGDEANTGVGSVADRENCARAKTTFEPRVKRKATRVSARVERFL